LGAAFHKIPEDAQAFPTREATPDGVVFVVGRVYSDKDEHGRTRERVEIQGIATTRAIALQMVRDPSYFIGPFPLNVLLPHRRIEWIGLEFPLKKDVRPDASSNA
jgi:hypothetical protein